MDARFRTVDGMEYKIDDCDDLGDIVNHGRHSSQGMIPATPVMGAQRTIWVAQKHIVSAWWVD